MRALAVLLLVGGCTPIERAFHCSSSAQCVSAGTAGSCEGDGWCSFPDASCDPTGRRYDIRGASIGHRRDGLIVHHYDYWNPAHLAAQIAPDAES